MISPGVPATSQPTGRIAPWIRSALPSVCGAFFLSRLLFLGTAAVSHTIVTQGAFAEPARSWIERLNRWDSTWYVGIAQGGYTFDPHGASSVGFYPLLPLLIRGLHACGLDWLVAGYTISHVALFVAGLFLWRLTLLETRSKTTASLAVVFLLLGPGAVWFGLIYTESLFLMTTLGCLLAARRGRWLEAGLWGYAAALTRTPGLFLAGFLFLEAIQQGWEGELAKLPAHRDGTAANGVPTPSRRWWPLPPRARAGLAVLGPVAGQLTFLIFLQVRFGDWHAQQKTVTAGWFHEGPRLPWNAVAENWRSNEPFYPLLADPVLAVVLIAAVASIWSLRRWGYPALTLALVALYLASTNGESLVRYFSTLAPVYIVLAQGARRSRLLETTLAGFSVALFVLITVLLVNGYRIN